jgi:hypothetical protein
MKYYFGRHFKFQHQYLDFVPHFFWLYLQVHAFVEYETVEDAEKAVSEFSSGRSWRDGIRVRSLLGCLVL